MEKQYVEKQYYAGQIMSGLFANDMMVEGSKITIDAGVTLAFETAQKMVEHSKKDQERNETQ